ncbi:MAG: Pyridoxal 5'-phosphate synthase subunit PdxT [Chlamydiae bacterium]|nr:Pyridoxal 5'-phosphate synthase subunit PdxT [Chlamydiota bacterium]
MNFPTVGVLALQGAFAKHMAAFQSLHAHVKEVRKPQELKECDALVIPGGESTTVARQIDFIGLREAIIDFAENKPILGTCAGLVLMAKNVIGHTITPFGFLDIEVERNGYGRQYESFTAEIVPSFPSSPSSFHAVFIRAPCIKKYGEKVKVLASYQTEPVLIQQDRFLAATFHPELSGDFSIHSYFLNML